MNALARHTARLTLREPGPALSRIISPLVLMTLMVPLYRAGFPGAEGTRRAVIGPLVLFSMLCISVVGNALLAERLWHTLERLRATPVRGAALLAGKCSVPLMIILIQQVATLTVGTLVFGLPVRSPLLLGVAGAAWAVTILCLGAALASVLHTPSAMSATTDIASLASGALSGALVPATALPGWARDLAPVAPGYWAVRAFDGALTGTVWTTVGACAVLLAVALAAGTFAARRLMR
jgi:ABC-2 type transport system permease protein